MRGFKEIFIFVAGASPQIITETIYALAQKKPPVHPDEIYIITTAHGKKIIIQALINEGILNSLCCEYGLPLINLGEENFIVPVDEHGQEIEDIRTDKDNEIIGDLISSFIREKAKDESARLHCSLAGGRKTMSFYLGSALQLFGRPWDKLYHVLVTPEFENNPEFYYKPKKNKLIIIKDKEGKERQLKTKDAQIFLAELPFIRLSHKFKFQRASFRELVAEGQREIDLAYIQPELRINLSDRLIFIGDKAIAMPPMLLFVYVAFCHQKLKACLHPERPYCYECRDCFGELIKLFDFESLKKLSNYYRALYRGVPLKTEEFLGKWERKNGLPVDTIRQYISKINKTIDLGLNEDSIKRFFTISAIRAYGSSRYGLSLEKSKIIFEETR
ncbi:MAG: CRISPR-associated ring nuclease Csm6 [Candidatus Aminicenantes bacterium]|nr:CRISPR-associated ring nuclease Csm6 [Candidatus Aminicenantes bacterium]